MQASRLLFEQSINDIAKKVNESGCPQCVFVHWVNIVVESENVMINDNLVPSLLENAK